MKLGTYRCNEDTRSTKYTICSFKNGKAKWILPSKTCETDPSAQLDSLVDDISNMESVSSDLADNVLTGLSQMFSMETDAEMTAENGAKIVSLIDQIGQKLSLEAIGIDGFVRLYPDFQMDIQLFGQSSSAGRKRSSGETLVCKGMNDSYTKMEVNIDELKQSMELKNKTTDFESIDRSICVAYVQGSYILFNQFDVLHLTFFFVFYLRNLKQKLIKHIHGT